MAMTQPQTTVHLLAGVPLDKGYNHTLCLKGVTREQQVYNFINGYLLQTFTLLTYQRYDKGELKLEVPADQVYNANYMIFRNFSYGSRWFFAFVDKVEYVSDNVTRIRYTIDDIQTWWYDFDFASCLVEREHTSSDQLGEWYVPEPFPESDMIFDDSHKEIIDFTPDSMMLVSSAENILVEGATDPQQPKARVVSHTITGLKYSPFAGNLDAGRVILDTITKAKSDWVVMAYAYPMKIHSANGYNYDEDAVVMNCPLTLDGYEPKNKKMLYNYPFVYVTVMDNASQARKYFYKLSSQAYSFRPKIQFGFYGCAEPTAAAIVFPALYKNEVRAIDEGIVFNDFPLISYTGDYYESWWRENGATVLTNAIFGVVGGALNIASASNNFGLAGKMKSGTLAQQSKVNQGDNQLLSGVMQIGESVINAATTINEHANHANTVNNANTPVDLRVAMGNYSAVIMNTTITADYAKVIDDFLSTYGYQMNEVKKPNIKDDTKAIRPYWNYLKTQNTILVKTGAAGTGVPADAASRLVAIFEKGITFWNSLENVGNYTLDNSPAE